MVFEKLNVCVKKANIIPGLVFDFHVYSFSTSMSRLNKSKHTKQYV